MTDTIDNMKLSYAACGIDFKKGNRLIKVLNQDFKGTERPGVMGSVGGFAALFDIGKLNYKDPLLVSGADGVGTKLVLAIEHHAYDTIGGDLVAMCVNDVITTGATPLFFLDYYSCGSLNLSTSTRLLKSVAHYCKVAGCALIGGETAEMPGLYPTGKIDVAGFAVGAVERDKLLGPHNCNVGDWCIALRSNGVHSNGYSLVRAAIDRFTSEGTEEDNREDMIPYKELLAPTTIYVNHVLSLLSTFNLHAIAHITGGGIYENLPRVMRPGQIAQLQKNWVVPPIFDWIQKAGNIASSEMMRVFNMGIGMVIIASAEDGPAILEDLNSPIADFAWKLGEIAEAPHGAKPAVVFEKE